MVDRALISVMLVDSDGLLIKIFSSAINHNKSQQCESESEINTETTKAQPTSAPPLIVAAGIALDQAASHPLTIPTNTLPKSKM
jgi:hypothetical protein